MAGMTFHCGIKWEIMSPEAYDLPDKVLHMLIISVTYRSE